MTDAERAALETMTPAQLIEGFVRDSKLIELSIERGKSDDANAYVDSSAAYGDEIADRGGLPSLAPLMENADPFIVYSAADRLADLPDFREAALAALDRVAEMNVGSASLRADRARNVIRFGNPNGDPVAYEKKLAEIRARYDRV